MAQPAPYTRTYNLTDEQSDNPLQPIAGAHLDTEFNNVKTTLDQTLANLALVQRDDGALKNSVVTVASLSTDVSTLMSAGEVRGAWVTATAYAIGDIVENSALAYIAIVAHTSGTFATDLAASKWVLLTGTAVPDNSVSTAKLQNLAVTTGKIADDAITADKIADDAVVTARIIDEAVTNAKLADVAGFALKGQVVGGTGAPVDMTKTQALAGLLAFVEPGHRLSLTGVSVPTTDQSGATSIRWTAHKHNLMPLFDGTRWGNYAVADLTLSLDPDSGHTYYHQSGKIFDLYVDYNAGTPRLAASRPWDSDSTRNSGAGISREATYGRYVNTSTMTVRFGTASGDTVSKDAGALLYVGTFRASADGQVTDSAIKRFLWNAYNRVPRHMRAIEGTDTWTYTTAAYRQVRADIANQLDFVRGLDEDIVTAYANGAYANDNVGVQARTAIGLDVTNAPVTGCLISYGQTPVANQAVTTFAQWKGLPGIGRRFLTWLEYSAATGTTTWGGDNGNANLQQTGIHGEIWA